MPDKKTTFTYELTNDQQELLLGVMLGGNYRRREVPYSLWSIEGDRFNATLYEKEKHGRRKLCIQGSGAEDFVLFVLEPRVLGAATLGYETILNPELVAPHAGSDESGKGDYFGPLVVCCAYTDEALSEKMQEMGVKDCKQMSDKSVLATGAKLRALLGPTGYSVVKLGPAAYNRLYAKIRNINRMLAWAHGTAIEELLEKRQSCPRVVVDQFAPTEATIRRGFRHRARDFPARHREDERGGVRPARGGPSERPRRFERPARQGARGGDGQEERTRLADEPREGALPDDGQGACRVREVARGPSAGRTGRLRLEARREGLNCRRKNS